MTVEVPTRAQTTSEIVNKYKPLLTTGEKVVRPIEEIYGIIGVGKSHLLLGISEQLKTVAGSVGRELAIAHIDYAKSHYIDLVSPRDDNKIDAIVMEDLAKQLGIDLGRTKSLGEKSKCLVDGIKTAANSNNSRLPVLVFDSLFEAEARPGIYDRIRIEEEVLFPVVTQEATPVLIGSRRKLFLEYFETRRRFDARHLDSLTPNESLAQLKSLEIDADLAQTIRLVSGDHPGANVFLAEHPNIKTDFDIAVDDLEKKYINRKLLADVSSEVQPFVWSILALRKFHTAQVRMMMGGLSTGDLNHFMSKPEGDYLDIIQGMIDGGVVCWNDTAGGYVIDDSLRKLMTGVLKTTKPETLISQHKIADQLYSGWFKEYPENSEHYLIEILYHNGELLKDGWTNEEDVRAKVGRLLQEIPQERGRLNEFGQNFRKLVREDGDLIGRFSPEFMSWLQAKIISIEERTEK